VRDKPDFAALRAKRDADFAKIIDDICAEAFPNTPPEELLIFDGPQGCYCSCSSGGPCEHQFTGWRAFEDGRGGEQVCRLCGMGAMSHSLRCDP